MPDPGQDNDTSPVPRHVAIIMYGNGRWSKQRGLPRVQGHTEGAESVRAALRTTRDAGIEFLTLYAFSSENWVRPPTEIRALMDLLQQFLKSHEYVLHENQVRLRTIGRTSELPKPVQRRLRDVMEKTRDYEKAQLILALSYGSRGELTKAVRKIARDVAAGSLDPDDVTEDTIASELYAPDMPDPDLMIRTSGAPRLGNFLSWQVSSPGLDFLDRLWP